MLTHSIDKSITSPGLLEVTSYTDSLELVC